VRPGDHDQLFELELACKFMQAPGDFLAGWMLSASTLGWPLIAAGAIKIAYDLLLLAMFRKVRPPEED
jgi:hypothetical protein